jgi:hypothetical protein
MEIGEWLRKMPPFPNKLKAIQMISSKANLVIISQTPLEAITREWEENDMMNFVMAIAAQ